MRSGQRFLRFLDNRRQTFLFVSLFLILVGARAVVINYAGNPTPYADEWDGEAANLLKPYLKGALTIGDLFHAHNEHVIFFTRLLTLGDLQCLRLLGCGPANDRQRDPRRRDRRRHQLRALTPASRRLGAGCDDIVRFGQCSSIELRQHIARIQYALLLVAGVFVREPVVHGRQQGVVAAMGGGSAVRARLVPLHGLGRADARRCDRSASHAGGMRSQRRACGNGWGSPPSPATTVVLVSLIPHVPSSDVYRAHSLRQFLSAVFELASWPAPPNLGALMALPSVLFCLRTFADRPALSDARWFNVAAFGWILTQFVAFAAGRALIPVEIRYLDTFVDRSGRQYDKLLLARGIGCGQRQAQDLVVCGPCGMARHRRGVAGPSRTPAARLDGPAAPNRRCPREKSALLSRHRRRVLSRRRAADRISPTPTRPGCANCSMRQKFAPPCRRSFSRGMRRRIGSKRSKGLSSAQGYVWLGAGVLLLIAVIVRGAWRRRPTCGSSPQAAAPMAIRNARSAALIRARRLCPCSVQRSPNGHARPLVGKRACNLGLHGLGGCLYRRRALASIVASWTGRRGSGYCVAGLCRRRAEKPPLLGNLSMRQR